MAIFCFTATATHGFFPGPIHRHELVAGWTTENCGAWPVRPTVTFPATGRLPPSASTSTVILLGCRNTTVRITCPESLHSREHSAVMATELLQPQDLACGTLFQSSCVIPTSPTDCSDDSWRETFFEKHEHGALWLLLLRRCFWAPAPLLSIDISFRRDLQQQTRR